MSERLQVHIRWMIRRDMPFVLEMERRGFQYPWSDEDFVRCLRQRNCIGMVAEDCNNVVAYMIYELEKRRIHLQNICVHPDYRRLGIGRQMMDKLMGKLCDNRRNRLYCVVRETNLPAQLFFRDYGLRALMVMRGHFSETSEDAYLFQIRHRAKVREVAK